MKATTMAAFPAWLVLHIPHDSTLIPDQVRPLFLLSDSELTLELQRMTDHLSHALFAQTQGAATVVRAPVSRLVVDVERFAQDSEEPMAGRGMGAIADFPRIAREIRDCCAEALASLAPD